MPYRSLVAVVRETSLLRRRLLLLSLLLVVLTFADVTRAWTKLAAVNVKGRVELINSRMKTKNGRLDASGVVVWLTPLDAGAVRTGPRQRRIINQRNKRFLPHVVAVEAGSEVDFPNDDPFFHNVFSIYNGKRFDLGLYASGETRPVNFNRPGVSYIFCNIHPQMSAVVVAVDTPYFTLSESSGALSIPNVPEGRYRLSVWHERAKPETLAALTRQVQLSGAGLDLGVIQVSEEGYVPRPHANKHGQEYDNELNRPAYRKP
ncbi:MAG: hypothetical protein JNJ50_16235 [Acidobacteria bacterium]|nr:hypothetical protein [Acidobacteriota bacterium]